MPRLLESATGPIADVDVVQDVGRTGAAEQDAVPVAGRGAAVGAVVVGVAAGRVVADRR